MYSPDLTCYFPTHSASLLIDQDLLSVFSLLPATGQFLAPGCRYFHSSVQFLAPVTAFSVQTSAVPIVSLQVLTPNQILSPKTAVVEQVLHPSQSSNLNWFSSVLSMYSPDLTCYFPSHSASLLICQDLVSMFSLLPATGSAGPLSSEELLQFVCAFGIHLAAGHGHCPLLLSFVQDLASAFVLSVQSHLAQNVASRLEIQELKPAQQIAGVEVELRFS
uniref:Uncharacterized protein n=1 Tax=Arundo donax TaxID=35708 RepID=A0A0A9CHV2_ARUDO